jgi:hypothetical protein
MSTQEVFIQQFASLLHYYSEALSSGTEQVRVPNSAASDEQQRLFEAARLAIQDLECRPRPESNARRYFAKPGEAEWGC